MPGEDVPLGDRICMAYMNTSVTRGRGEMIVTATGMDTEIGHIADMLANTESREDAAPEAARRAVEDHRVDRRRRAGRWSSRSGWSRDESFDDAVHHRRRAGRRRDPDRPAGGRHDAAVDRHPGDRPAERDREAAAGGRDPRFDVGDLLRQDRHADAQQDDRARAGDPGQNRFTVSGEGYSTEGEIKHVGGSNFDLDPYLLPMVLCADAVLDGESLIGDPTEGALIVLAAKGGLDIEETRAAYPRIAEVPFDSDYKFMATFHEMTGQRRPAGRALLREGRARRVDLPRRVVPGPGRNAACRSRTRIATSPSRPTTGWRQRASA